MRMAFATIWINDEDRALEFYVGKLGFTLIIDNPTAFGTRFLMLMPPGGGTRLVLSRPVPGMEGARVGGFAPVAWEVDDLMATYEELQSKGVSFPEPPKKQPWGGLQANFADPDGNLFMLNQAD